jgi:hypothetical protein
VQNINIVYKVDKSEVDRSNAAVNQAKALTDQLKKSAQDYGTTAAKANQQASGSIEQVKVKMAQLRAQIELTNRSDTKRMNDLTKQYQVAKKQVDDFNKSLKDQQHLTQQSAANVNSAAGAFMNMYSAIKLVIGAAIVRELVNTTLEAAVLAGQVEAVGNAFRKQIPASEQLLFRLQRATHGTVSDIELMQKALKFQNFGADVEALPQILEFAAVRAQQTGVSIEYMVNGIIDGIGRKSLRVLDNLQLSTTDIKNEMHGLSMEAATVAQVSEAMGRVATRELQKMGAYAENSATQVDQLKRAVTALSEEWAKFVTGSVGSGIIGFFQQYVDKLKDLIEITNRGISAEELYAERRVKNIALISATEFEQNVLNKSKEENIKLVEEEIARLTQSLGVFAKEKAINDEIIAGLYEQWKARKGNQYIIEENIDIQKRSIAAKQEDAIIDQEILRLLLAKLAAYKKLNDEQNTEFETIKKLQDKLADLKKQREEETFTGNTAELDRLQREIILLEDRILKIGDNIAWQKKWTNQSAIDTAKKWEETEAIEAQVKAIEKLNQQFRIDSIGKGSITENINIEDDPEDDQSFKLVNEKWVRFRIAMKKAFGQTKIDMNELFEGLKEDVINLGVDMTAELIEASVNLELASFETRLNNTQRYYDRLQGLAGDNERVKKELALREQRDSLKIQKEMAEKQKRANMNGILINTAASVAKTAAQLGFPAAIPFIAIALATGATQYGIASKTPTGYKDGVIDLKGGTPGKDSVHSLLMPGESVMTAKETKTSRRTLEMIRAKTLDDTVLSRIASRAKGGDGGSIFDDSRMVEAINKAAKASAGNDLVKKGSFIYEVKKESDSLKTYIKSKVL